MHRSELAQDGGTGGAIPRPDEPIDHDSPYPTEPAEVATAEQPLPRAPDTEQPAPPEANAQPEQPTKPKPTAEAEPTAGQATEPTADTSAPAWTATPSPRPASTIEAESAPGAPPGQPAAQPPLTPGAPPAGQEPVAQGAPAEATGGSGPGPRAPAVSPGWGHLAESDHSAEAEQKLAVDERARDTKRGAGRGRRWGRRAVVIVATLALMGIIPAFIARMYTIPSESMETTLHGCAGCDNDRVLVDRMVYRFRNPHPGEVVVFTPGPEIWGNSEEQQPPEINPFILGLRSLGSKIGIKERSGPDFVKRVIAVGGQTVFCCDSRNRIMVDGVAVDEPYVYFSQTPFPKVKVPAAMMWMMGDNRNASLDSRAPGNGPVPLAALDGKVRMIIYPFSRLGSVDDTNPQAHR
jgi:signal peptidase I